MMNILFLLMLLAYGFGALAALIFGYGLPARGLSALGAVIGSLAGFTLGVTHLASGQLIQLSNPVFLPLTGFALRLDGLGAFFLIVVGLVGASASI